MEDTSLLVHLVINLCIQRQQLRVLLERHLTATTRTGSLNTSHITLSDSPHLVHRSWTPCPRSLLLLDPRGHTCPLYAQSVAPSSKRLVLRSVRTSVCVSERLLWTDIPGGSRPRGMLADR
jgi:hypothetical protein